MNYEFKGTKGTRIPVYISGVCIGVGIELDNGTALMTSNSILPDTDEEYENDKIRIESDMKMDSCAPEMFEMLKLTLEVWGSDNYIGSPHYEKIQQLLKKATTI